MVFADDLVLLEYIKSCARCRDCKYDLNFAVRYTRRHNRVGILVGFGLWLRSLAVVDSTTMADVAVITGIMAVRTWGCHKRRSGRVARRSNDNEVLTTWVLLYHGIHRRLSERTNGKPRYLKKSKDL
ncbi:unnamed protein product [Musa hybrid cultivar]